MLARMGPVKGVTPVLFGTSEGCQCHASDIVPMGLKGTACKIHMPDGEAFDCLIPTPGAHMVSNALAGAAVGAALGLAVEEIKAGIEAHMTLPGRNNIISTGSLMILDDCYNANPISTKAAIDVLDMAIGRKVAVIGNMGELGNNEKELHREVGVYAARHGVDVLCAIGELAKEIAAGADGAPGIEVLWFATKQDFLAQMNSIIKEGDNVLVKASHGMWFPEIVEQLVKFS